MLIERFTTEAGDPDEIHAFGLSEVERIGQEMLGIAADAGFPGDLAGYRAALLARPGQILPRAQALLERMEVLSKRIDGRLPVLSGRLPRMSYGVRSIPEAVAAIRRRRTRNPTRPTARPPAFIGSPRCRIGAQPTCTYRWRLTRRGRGTSCTRQ